MIKRRKFCIAAIVMVMVMSLAGCGGFDPVALVKANLDLYKTGEVTDELMEATDQTEEEVKQIYEESVVSEIDSLIDALDCEAYETEEKRAVVEEFVLAAYKAMNYEVQEDYTESDGVYFVDVAVYPMDIMDKMETYINDTMFTEWENKISSGEYTITTEEQLMIDMYDELFAEMIEMVNNVEYGEKTVVTIRVEDVGDNTYVPNEDDLNNIFSVMLGTL